jgi:hypothetical protein
VDAGIFEAVRVLIHNFSTAHVPPLIRPRLYKRLHAIWVMYNNQIATSVFRQQIADYEDAVDVFCAFAYPSRELLSTAYFSFALRVQDYSTRTKVSFTWSSTSDFVLSLMKESIALLLIRASARGGISRSGDKILLGSHEETYPYTTYRSGLIVTCDSICMYAAVPSNHVFAVPASQKASLVVLLSL